MPAAGCSWVQLREGQREKGTRAPHRFGHHFPGFLTSGGHRAHLAVITDRHGLLVADLRQSVLDSPATTDPATRTSAATGDPLPEP